jgi:hypothetical protein
MTLRAGGIWIPLTIAACLSAAATHKAAPAARAQKFDPCALLRPAEIEAVQGEKPVDAKSDRPQRGEFEAWQCFYTLPTFAKSISLEVTRKDTSRPDAASPRAHWQTMFHETEGSAGEGEEAGEASGPPVPVDGVGDEAFWSGNGVVGALYVLKGDAYLRLSIGGSEDDSEKLQKSKTLASKALKRL